MERDSNLKEAWLNKAGTRLAVVGGEKSTRKSRAKTVETVVGKNGVKLTELTGTARKKELESFLTGEGWFRGADVDNLSKEEARIIAARLVSRIQATVTLSDKETKGLEIGFADVLKQRFIDEPGKTERKTREQTKQELLKVARAHLDEKRVALLQETLAKDYRAEGNEK